MPAPHPRGSATTSSRLRGAVNHRSLRSRKTSGISESCLRNWLAKANLQDGVKPSVTSTENAELREARK